MYESNYKEYLPYVITLPNWTPIFEWSMVLIIVDNGHHSSMCHNGFRV